MGDALSPLVMLEERMRCLWKFQQCQEKFRLFCTEVYLSMSFILCLEQIENKQPVQTSFRCVLWRQQFDLAEAVVTFFLVSKDTQHEMHALSRIFHLKAQNEPSLVQTRVKAKDRKQAQTLLFPSVRWSKSWNLRDGLCV